MLLLHSPMVYFIFVELYGKDTSLELTRYVLDIYKPSVAVDKLMAIYITGKVCLIMIKMLLMMMMLWFIDDDDHDDDEEGDNDDDDDPIYD